MRRFFKHSLICAALTLASMQGFALIAYAESFPAISGKCPNGSTYDSFTTGGEFPQQIEVCNYTPSPICTGQTILGNEITLPNGKTSGGQCYPKGTPEYDKFIKAAADVTDPNTPGGSSCPTNYHYFDTTKKCYRIGSQQYTDALNQAKENLLIPKSQKINVSGYKVQIPIPCQPLAGGQCANPDTPAGYIARIYQFGLMIVGFAAFTMIVYGGILYVFAAGDIGKTSDAKEVITNAIYGLILFLGAYIILYTINPNLVNLRNPQLEFLQVENLAPAPETTGLATQGGLGSGGTGAGDSLCDLAVNGSIGISFNAGSLSSSGDKTTSACVKCTTNASKGADGKCACNKGFAQYNGTCQPIKAADQPCIDAGGYCQFTDDPNTQGYIKGLCRSDASPNYLCYKP